LIFNIIVTIDKLDFDFSPLFYLTAVR